MKSERQLVIRITGENLEVSGSGFDQSEAHAQREDSPQREGTLANLQNHSIENYTRHVAHLLETESTELAMAKAIGCQTMEDWVRTGDGQVAVLRYHGLTEGMSIYDLGCGSGRTASALVRSGWHGHYKGHDIVEALVDYLRDTCPGYHAAVNREFTVLAPDESQDMVFHWSVFTHLFIEECYLYLQDIFRALKPGGKLVFSFLELEDPNHRNVVFLDRVDRFRHKLPLGHLDTFLHRSQIGIMAEQIGFTGVEFTDGMDTTHHPAFWQSLVSMRK